MTTSTPPDELVRGGLPLEHLMIGECILSRRPVLVTTVLGSCVSATFFHEKTRTGAVFHAMLPTSALGRDADTAPCKYVDTAIAAIMRRLRALGARPADLDVKLFGGGFTIQPERKHLLRSVVDVGDKNVTSARAELARLGLAPSYEGTLGARGRKLFFHTGTGEVWMKYVDDHGRDARMESYPFKPPGG